MGMDVHSSGTEIWGIVGITKHYADAARDCRGVGHAPIAREYFDE